MSRAILIIITSSGCPACIELIKDRKELESGYKLRKDVDLRFLYTNNANMRLDIFNLHPQLQTLVKWTPFVILITPSSFTSTNSKNELKYEIMNIKSIVNKSSEGSYSQNKTGIDQFVRTQLQQNPIFSTKLAEGLTVTSVTQQGNKRIKTNSKQHYSLDRQIYSTLNGKYSKDEL